MHALRVLTVSLMAFAMAATSERCQASDVAARVNALELLVKGDRKAGTANDTATVQLEHQGITHFGLTLESQERVAQSSLARVKKDKQELDAKLDAFHKVTQGQAYNEATGLHGLGSDCRDAKTLTAAFNQLSTEAGQLASGHIATINAIPIGRGDSIARLVEETNAIDKASKALFATPQTHALFDDVKKLAQGFKAHQKEGALVVGAADAAVKAARELRTEAFTLQKLNVEIVPMSRAYITARAEAFQELAALKGILKNPSDDHTLAEIENTLDSSYAATPQHDEKGKTTTAEESAVNDNIKKGDDAIAEIQTKRGPIDRERASCGEPLLAEKFDDDRAKAAKEIAEAKKTLVETYLARANLIVAEEKKAQTVIETEKANLAVINPKIEKLKTMYDATPKENTARRQKILARIRELQKVGKRSTNNILNMQLAHPILAKEEAATRQQGNRAGGALGTGLTMVH